MREQNLLNKVKFNKHKDLMLTFIVLVNYGVTFSLQLFYQKVWCMFQ